MGFLSHDDLRACIAGEEACFLGLEPIFILLIATVIGVFANPVAVLCGFP